MEKDTIRTAVLEDLEALAEIEAACFPPAQAASKESLQARLELFPHHFYVYEREGKLLGFINGFVTEERDLLDEMYEKAALHREEGAWQMIFGLDTLPAYQRQGIAARLMEHMIGEAKAQKRAGVVLTCLDALVEFYKSFGFRDEGISGSSHGNAAWHQMRLVF